MSGHYRMARGWQDHPVFRSETFSRRDAWVWLIEEAAFKPRVVTPSGIEVRLERGQLAHSLRFMARAWKWDEAKVRRFLARLQKENMIDARTDAGVTHLTVCEYDTYQAPTNDTDAAPAAAVTRQRRGGDANEKKGRKKGNITEPNGSGAAAPPNDDMKARLFGPVLEWLTERSERSRVGVRSQIGRWCKLYGDGAVLAAAQRAYTACRDGPPVDPIAWMEAALKKDAKHGKQPDVGERIARDAEDIDRYFRVEPGDEPAGDGEPVFDFDGDCRRVA